jgi:hypothetical protein
MDSNVFDSGKKQESILIAVSRKHYDIFEIWVYKASHSNILVSPYSNKYNYECTSCYQHLQALSSLP